MSDADYGDATFTRHDDGRVTVDHADDVVGISLDLLAMAEAAHLPVDDAGCILLAGDPRYRYRPVRFATDPGDPTEMVRVLVCERVRDV
jgi:hypothetical protein